MDKNRADKTKIIKVPAPQITERLRWKRGDKCPELQQGFIIFSPSAEGHDDKHHGTNEQKD